MTGASPIRRAALVSLSAVDAGLTFGLAPDPSDERLLLATAALRILVTAYIAVRARRPRQGLHRVALCSLLTLLIALWRINLLVQWPASTPPADRPRFIALLVLQVVFAIAHWLGYALVFGTRAVVSFQPASPLASETVHDHAVDGTDGTPELAEVDARSDSESDTDEEDLIDPRLSRRASIASNAAYVRARTVSSPNARRLTSYGSIHGPPGRVIAPPPSA